jgi:hypothetical protein
MEKVVAGGERTQSTEGGERQAGRGLICGFPLLICVYVFNYLIPVAALSGYPFSNLFPLCCLFFFGVVGV